MSDRHPEGAERPRDLLVELSRRDALKLAAVAPLAGVASSPGMERVERFMASLAAAENNQPAYVPRFFTAKEWRTVRVLADYVIPRDSISGSATDAKAPEYMDFVLHDEATSENNRIAVRGGLAWLDTECRKRFDGKTFIQATDAERKQVLDDIAYPRKAKPEHSYGVTFFNRFRDMTAAGFYSSKMGWDDLKYIGNVFNPGWNGCGDAANAKLGVSHDLMKTFVRPENDKVKKQKDRLGIGFIGSGFNAKFHMLGMKGVRDVDVLGVWSPNKTNAAIAADYARQLDVGQARAYRSIAEMVADPNIDAIWVTGPNQARIENFEEIADTVDRGRGELLGIACEKPLARNVAEAKEVVRLAKQIGVKTGYLENQVFAPQVEAGHALLWARGAATTGRPYLARAGEEHSGPHMPWFWRGELQGGGVLNDMMCHSALLIQHLLVKPGDALSTVKPTRVTAHIASLKWSRPEYAKRLQKTMGKDVDYAKSPSEDYATLHVEYETSDGYTVHGEASTSWSFVGAGLRLSAELLGPEYSMQWNSLDAGLRLFFSREVKGRAGEDLVEKQNAEMGLMPVVTNEALAYGYTDEDRHFARVFLGKEKARLTFDDGLDVVKMLMTAYQSAEQGRTLEYPGKAIDKFVPAVAKGTWKP